MSYDGAQTPISKAAAAQAAPRLLDQVRARMRLKHYSLRTEQAYLYWIRRYIRASGLRHPRELNGVAVERFLTRLSVHDRVAASTQNQALSALLFLYREVLAIDLPWMENVVRAKRPQRLPVVLSTGQVTALLGCLSGREALMAALLYGSGLRLMECVRLRVKDVDFARGELTIRAGKGSKDRVTVLPTAIRADLRRQIECVRSLHMSDLAKGLGAVYLPFALARKYPALTGNWPGNTSFPPRAARSIRAMVRASGTTSKRCCSAQSGARRSVWEWTSRSPLTPCVTALPRTCLSPARISARSRNCWAIRM